MPTDRLLSGADDVKVADPHGAGAAMVVLIFGIMTAHSCAGAVTIESAGESLDYARNKERDAAFVHDTLMMPESGSSRADFPGGSTEDLWYSLGAILDLPADTRLYVGHDYPDEGKAPEYMATVAEHRLRNRHVKDGIGKAKVMAMREARDAALPLPARMLAALQVNIRGGRLPEGEGDGQSYLKIPVGKFEPR